MKFQQQVTVYEIIDYYRINGQSIVSVTPDCDFTATYRQAGKGNGLCTYCNKIEVFLHNPVGLP